MRKHLIASIQQEYGARLVDTLIKSAVLTLPSYTYTDIGQSVLTLTDAQLNHVVWSQVILSKTSLVGGSQP